MKKWLRFELSVVIFTALVVLLGSCKERKTSDETDLALSAAKNTETSSTPKKQLSEDFKKYWYAGEAEITSYKLAQARYGEIRDGKAVLVYVTEPFLKNKQVKADGNNPDNIPVLKLNSTKNYLTGIYPYAIMSSSFYPVYDNQHAVKVSFSSQEWCGQVYAQLNNRDAFEITSHSYFESEADEKLKLDKTILENELWNKIRINPDQLPTGTVSIIPSMEFIRLSHKELKSYNATITLVEKEGIKTYQINYPDLERVLKIDFKSIFPYTIEGWSDSFKSGFGTKAKIMTSTATKIHTLKTPYWRQNSNSFLPLRETLGL